MTTDTITPASIRFSAMNLLAMREHSSKELQAKLEQRFANEDLVADVVARLAQENLQSDERFAEAFVTMRFRQGKGPARIILELRDKGVSLDLIDQFVELTDSRWTDLALREKNKRFGELPSNGLKEKARQIKFLQYRGFTSAQIKAAVP